MNRHSHLGIKECGEPVMQPAVGDGWLHQENRETALIHKFPTRMSASAGAPTPRASNKNILLIVAGVMLTAMLAACGTALPTAGAGEKPTRVIDDITSLKWQGAAIGYSEDGIKLESNSLDRSIVVTGSGADIWSTRDEFYFAYTTLDGDGAMSVRLDDLSADDPWAKAGVMIRESLDPDAPNALIHISAENGSVFQSRLVKGDPTVNFAGRDSSATAGGWVRLTRVGDVLTGDLSADGENWTEVGQYEIPFGGQVLIGLAVTAHARGAKAIAKFSSFKFQLGDFVKRDPPESKPIEPAPPSAPVAPGGPFVLPPATLYVATNGSDSNTGRSASAPLRTITKAASIVKPGDVVYIRGGVYPLEVKFRTSGTATAPIVWASYPGEWAIFDGSNRRKGQDMDRMWVDGASYNVFANFEVRNGPRQGIYVINGSNDNRFTGLVSHGNNGSGIQNVSSSRNRYEYLTLYDNYDEVNPRGETGEDADGIGLTSGDRNVVSHVISYGNSDDGFDAWKSTNTIIEYSIAHSNGKGSHGNGNGFKAGGGVDNRTIVRHSIAYNNRAVGFTNNSGLHVTFVNNTAFKNGSYDFLGHSTTTFQNNLSIGGRLLFSSSPQSHNSWNLGITDARYLSTDPTNPDFLSLAVNSPAIDAGVDVGYDYSGRAPDLGALEYSVTIAFLGNLNLVN